MHDFVLFLILRGKARYISRGTASWKNRRATAKTPRRQNHTKTYCDQTPNNRDLCLRRNSSADSVVF